MKSGIVVKMGAEGFHASRSGVRGFFQELRYVPKHLMRKHSSWLAYEAGITGDRIIESLSSPSKRKKGKTKYGRRPSND